MPRHGNIQKINATSDDIAFTGLINFKFTEFTNNYYSTETLEYNKKITNAKISV